jgi:hypothetical protein
MKLIRDFKTFCKLFIFPFVVFTGHPAKKRVLEYWMSTKGLLMNEVHFKFLEKEVTPTLHLIGLNLFRMKFYVVNKKTDVSPDGLRIDIKCSPHFMKHHFEY